MTVEDALRKQLLEAFEGADYPVKNEMDLLPALPDGPATKFEAGDVSISVMELSSDIGDDADFPYEDAESLVEDVIKALRAEGKI